VTVAVRSCEPRDAVALAAIHARAWRAAYESLMPAVFLDEFEASRAAAWQRYLNDPEMPPIYVSLRPDGAPSGFIALAIPSRDDRGSVEVAALNVDPAAWGHGAGTALMSAATRHFQDLPQETATLWVVDGNARAQRFYERLGWRYDGITKTHVGTGVLELHMRLELSSESGAAA
jgi:RimJ/RimL family protein N-acetyltransferase